MMTFEDFFKRKKINLPTLQQGEPALFAEFERHYAQMGEKSFDHTKKYWFNQLRRRFPLPAEVKAPKAVIENPLAEQTIVESLAETTTQPAASPGFKPRFKAATPAQPASAPAEPVTEKPAEATPLAESASEAPKPATGFKPRFKATAPPKPVEETPTTEITSVPADPVAEKSAETTASSEASTEAAKPAVGFKPRFKAASPPKQVEERPAVEPEPIAAESAETAPSETAAEPAKPAVGFKPRFKAATPPKQVEEMPAAETSSTLAEPGAEKPIDAAPSPEATTEIVKPAVGFKPRFKASAPPRQAEEIPAANEIPPVSDELSEQASVEATIPEPQPEPPTDTPAKPVGFKPRFKAGVTKTKPPEEE